MKDTVATGKDVLSPEAMSHRKTSNGVEMKVIFQHVSLENIGREDLYADFTAYVIFRVP